MLIYINLSERTAGWYSKISIVANIIDTFLKGDIDACTPWKNVIAEEMKNRAEEYDRLRDLGQRNIVFQLLSPPADGDDPKRYK